MYTFTFKDNLAYITNIFLMTQYGNFDSYFLLY